MSDLLKELPAVEEIKTALTYKEAKAILDLQIPSVVLLDIHLGEKNGIELLKFIKRSKSTSCVMIVSNLANEYYRRLCLKLGADYFFDKTHDFALIPEAISKLAIE